MLFCLVPNFMTLNNYVRRLSLNFCRLLSVFGAHHAKRTGDRLITVFHDVSFINIFKKGHLSKCFN